MKEGFSLFYAEPSTNSLTRRGGIEFRQPGTPSEAGSPSTVDMEHKFGVARLSRHRRQDSLDPLIKEAVPPLSLYSPDHAPSWRLKPANATPRPNEENPQTIPFPSDDLLTFVSANLVPVGSNTSAGIEQHARAVVIDGTLGLFTSMMRLAPAHVPCFRLADDEWFDEPIAIAIQHRIPVSTRWQSTFLGNLLRELRLRASTLRSPYWSLEARPEGLFLWRNPAAEQALQRRRKRVRVDRSTMVRPTLEPAG